MKIDPNAPAFSRAGFALSPEEWDEGAEGMSIRTWLAGMVLQGILANPGPLDGMPAVHAVANADALIAELNKEPAR